MQTQLLHDFAAMGIHGLSAQVQRRGDFASRRLTSCSLASARWADALNTHGAERGTGARRPRSGMITECNRFVPIEALFKDDRSTGRSSSFVSVGTRVFKLSLRELAIMMADRGITLTHTTILRWAQRYLPEFEKRWSRFARPVRGSWRMDETYIKVDGRWVYLYRAVDKAGRTVDFLLSRNRDVNAAKSFLRSAIKNTRTPT
jgi:hypothetical protein